MRGEYLAKLMQESWLCEELAKHARRYSKRVENQEEYIQDAWLRIAEHQENMDLEYYAEQGARAINAARMRKSRKLSVVHKKKVYSVHGISVTGKDAKPPPKRAIKVYDNKYLDPKHETLDWEYYEGQEADIKARADEWYNQHAEFESLSTAEREKVIGRFINAGYIVGLPVGATPGKKTRFYKMYAYNVDSHGVVSEAKKPRELDIDRSYAQPGGNSRQGVDLSTWHRLRLETSKLGGHDDFIEWIDTNILTMD